MFLSVIFEEMGVESGELSEDTASCLREWVAGADLMELFADEFDAVSAVVPGLVGVLPDLLDVTPDPGTSLTIALEDAIAVAIDEETQGELNEPGQSNLFVFEAVEGELYQINVALGTLADSVVALYDAYEWLLAANNNYKGSLASRVVWLAPSSGSYYIAVSSWDNGTGSYTLTVIVR